MYFTRADYYFKNIAKRKAKNSNRGVEAEMRILAILISITALMAALSGCQSIMWLSGMPYDHRSCSQTTQMGALSDGQGTHFRLMRYYDYKTWSEGDGFFDKFLRTRLLLLRDDTVIKRWQFGKPMKGVLHLSAQGDPVVDISEDSFTIDFARDSCH
jgi:hypothetical protein